jgi:DNA-binding response OmpR family regulator
VLIIGDDPGFIALLSFGLDRAGYEVTGATDGESGLRRFRAEAPDLVLLDLNLPRHAGFAVCARIRERASTPIIALSTGLREAEAKQALHLGADDHLAKPFRQQELRARMAAVLGRRAQTLPAPRGLPI